MVSCAAASSIEEPSGHDTLLTPPSSPRSVRLGEGGPSSSGNNDGISGTHDKNSSGLIQGGGTSGSSAAAAAALSGRGIIRKSDMARHARLRPVAPPLSHKPHAPPCLPTLLLRQLRPSEGTDPLDPPTSSNSPCSPSSCSETVAEVHAAAAAHAVERLSLDELANTPVTLQMPRCAMRDSPDFKSGSLLQSPPLPQQQSQKRHKSASVPQMHPPHSPPYPQQRLLMIPRSSAAALPSLTHAQQHEEQQQQHDDIVPVEESDEAGTPECCRLSESSLHHCMGESMQSNIVQTNSSVTHIFKPGPEPGNALTAITPMMTLSDNATMHDISPALSSQEDSMPTSPVLNRALSATSSLLRQRCGCGPTMITASVPRRLSGPFFPPPDMPHPTQALINTESIAMQGVMEQQPTQNNNSSKTSASESAGLTSKVVSEPTRHDSDSTDSVKPLNIIMVAPTQVNNNNVSINEVSVHEEENATAVTVATAANSSSSHGGSADTLRGVAQCTQLSNHQIYDAHTTPLLLPLYHGGDSGLAAAIRDRGSVSLAKSSLPSVSSQHAGSIIGLERRSQMSQLHSRTAALFLPNATFSPDSPNRSHPVIASCREMNECHEALNDNSGGPVAIVTATEEEEHYDKEKDEGREWSPNHQPITAVTADTAESSSALPPALGTMTDGFIRSNPLERPPSLHIFDERSVNSFGSLCHMTDSIPVQERRLTLDKSLVEGPALDSPRRDARRASCMRATITAVHGFFFVYIIISTFAVHYFTDLYCDWFNALNYDHKMHVFSDRKAYYFLLALICTPLFLLSHWGVYCYRSNPRRQRQLHMRRLTQIQHELNAPVRSPRHHYGGSHSTYCNFSHRSLRERRQQQQQQQQQQQRGLFQSQMAGASSSTSVKLNEVVFPRPLPTMQDRLGRLGHWLAAPLRRLMLRRSALVNPNSHTGVENAANGPAHMTTTTVTTTTTTTTDTTSTPTPQGPSAALPAVEMHAMLTENTNPNQAVPSFARSMDDSSYYCGGQRPEQSILCAPTRLPNTSHRQRGSLLMSHTRASVLACERLSSRRASLPTVSSAPVYGPTGDTKVNDSEEHPNIATHMEREGGGGVVVHAQRPRDTPPPSPSRLTSSYLALRSPLDPSPPHLPRTPPPPAPPLHNSMTEHDGCNGGGHDTAGVPLGAHDSTSTPSHGTGYEEDQELLIDVDADLSVPCWPSICCCELDRFSVMTALCAISRLWYFVVVFTALVLLLVLAFNRLVSFALMDPSYSMWYNALVKDDCDFVEKMELHASCSGWTHLCREKFATMMDAHDRGCAFCPAKAQPVRALRVTCQQRFETLRWRNLCTYIVLVCVNSILLIFTIITSSMSICMNYWA